MPNTTGRLVLRALTSSDLTPVFDILSDERTTARVSWRQTDIASARRWLERRVEQEREHGLSMWGMEARTDGTLIGLCGFFPHDGADEIEIGYVVKAPHWGHGYGTEAACAAVAAALAAGHRVYATIRPWNTASIRVAEHAGLQADGQIDDDRGALIVYRSPAAPVRPA